MNRYAIEIWQLFLLGRLHRPDGSVVMSVVEAHYIATHKPAA
ncbi:hypothetical protein [Pantoea agglomerans]|nr:hypothetical protein [Pantoea agglomerans]MDQ0435613.1 hypothetical protein [Pantoea agglomerans]